MTSINSDIAKLRFALGQTKKERSLLVPFKSFAFFMDGNAYATNGIILYRCSIKRFVDEPSLLEGKCISFDNLALMGKAKRIKTDGDSIVLDGYLRLSFGKMTNKNGRWFFGEDMNTVPDFDSVIPVDEGFAHTHFSIDPVLLNSLLKCFGTTSIKLIFTSDMVTHNGFPSGPILVKPAVDPSGDYSAVGLIMPKAF